MKPLHELDALCAEKVAGIKAPEYVVKCNGITISSGPDTPRYTTDPAAVLGLLEKCRWSANGGLYTGEPKHSELYEVEIHRCPGRPHFTYHGRGEAPTFALAATLALLKAHGCEVGE